MHQEALISLYLQRYYGRYIQNLSFLDQTVTITVAPKDSISFLTGLKLDEKLQFTQLLDVFAVDYPKSVRRFELNYSLLSVGNNVRLLVKTRPDGDWAISVSGLYSSAVWLEREVWDMFGIFFYNHPDLRRI